MFEVNCNSCNAVLYRKNSCRRNVCKKCQDKNRNIRKKSGVYKK